MNPGNSMEKEFESLEDKWENMIIWEGGKNANFISSKWEIFCGYILCLKFVNNIRIKSKFSERTQKWTWAEPSSLDISHEFYIWRGIDKGDKREISKLDPGSLKTDTCLNERELERCRKTRELIKSGREKDAELIKTRENPLFMTIFCGVSLGKLYLERIVNRMKAVKIFAKLHFKIFKRYTFAFSNTLKIAPVGLKIIKHLTLIN